MPALMQLCLSNHHPRNNLDRTAWKLSIHRRRGGGGSRTAGNLGTCIPTTSGWDQLEEDGPEANASLLHRNYPDVLGMEVLMLLPVWSGLEQHDGYCNPHRMISVGQVCLPAFPPPPRPCLLWLQPLSFFSLSLALLIFQAAFNSWVNRNIFLLDCQLSRRAEPEKAKPNQPLYGLKSLFTAGGPLIT